MKRRIFDLFERCAAERRLRLRVFPACALKLSEAASMHDAIRSSLRSALHERLVHEHEGNSASHTVTSTCVTSLAWRISKGYNFAAGL
jgi:hypothetical protein